MNFRFLLAPLLLLALSDTASAQTEDSEAPAPAAAAEAPVANDSSPADEQSPGTSPSETSVHAADAAPIDPNTCEIHVWASQLIGGYSTGWAVALGPIAAAAEVEGRKDFNTIKREQITAILTPQVQFNAIGKVDFSRIVGGKSYRLIPEASPVDIKTVEKDKARKTASAHGCYYELVVLAVNYYKAALYSGRLYTTLTLRRFGDAAEMTSATSSNNVVSLDVFTSGIVEVTPEAAEEVRNAFNTSVSKVLGKMK